MLPDFTPEIEQRILKLTEACLDGDKFWEALGTTNSPYLDYIWRQQLRHLSPAEVWQAATAMMTEATSLQLWQFPHQQLAEMLPATRQLQRQQVPCIRQYGEYLLAQFGAKAELRTLMQQVNYAEVEDVEFMLSRMMELLLNRLILCIGARRYLFREVEVYFCQPRTHQDPYVHISPEQQRQGNWYFNKAETLDLTFGDQECNTWGGILLRGMQAIPPAPSNYLPAGQPETDYLRGPRIVLRDIIANLNGVFQAPYGIRLDEIDTFIQEPPQPWRVRRYGLYHKPKDDPEQNFLRRRYRFLVDKEYLRGLKDRADVVRQLQLPPNEAKEVLGYYPAI